jgi:hypothetical protein
MKEHPNGHRIGDATGQGAECDGQESLDELIGHGQRWV